MTNVRKSDWFKQSNKLRRTLRRLEPEITKNVKTSVRLGAEAVHHDAMVSLRSELSGMGDGDLLASIEIKYGRDGLTAIIGPSASTVTPKKNPFDTGLYRSDMSKYKAFQFFKGYWFELGTEEGKRGSHDQDARPFLGPAYESNRKWIAKKTQAAVSVALNIATRGS